MNESGSQPHQTPLACPSENEEDNNAAKLCTGVYTSLAQRKMQNKNGKSKNRAHEKIRRCGAPRLRVKEARHARQIRTQKGGEPLLQRCPSIHEKDRPSPEPRRRHVRR